jgi:hypothetical protein
LRNLKVLTQAQHTKKHVTMFFFHWFSLPDSFSKKQNPELSPAQSTFFLFNTISLWDSMSCFHACAGKRYVARLGDAKETKRKGRRSDRNDLRHCETKKGSFVFIAHDFLNLESRWL